MSGDDKESNTDQPRLDDLISLSEAADLSGLSTSYLRRLVSQGKIWGKKIGRNWATTERAVREFLSHERRPGPKPEKGS